MWALYRSRFRTSFVFEDKCIFKGIPDSCNTTLLHCKFMNIFIQINEVVQMSCAPLAAQGQCEYRLWIWWFTARSIFCIRRTCWIHCREANVLHFHGPKYINWLYWTGICYCVRSELLADFCISKHNRHCLQNSEENFSSVCHWSSLQAVTFLLAVL